MLTPEELAHRSWVESQLTKFENGEAEYEVRYGLPPEVLRGEFENNVPRSEAGNHDSERTQSLAVAKSRGQANET
jgi:hypothetical protein